MLNISNNTIKDKVDLNEFSSCTLIRKSRVHKVSRWVAAVLVITFVLSLFLPWTQNISTKGYITTLLPEQRPQSIQSVIAGRLEQWFVREGDFVNKGDTIVFISEVKNDYFDPDLLLRTQEQLDAKIQSVASYEQKVIMLEKQYKTVEEALVFKRQQLLNKIIQAKNKISIDSIDLVAYQNNFRIAENQFVRTNDLYKKGLKTLTEVQDKEYKVQAARAKVSVQENKLINQKNILINLKIDNYAIENDYSNKMAKVQSDIQSAISYKLTSVGEVSKLRNKLRNYNERVHFYHILAPQSGYITKVLKKGLGETVKEGTTIATIMPSEYDLAAELYIKPQDLPLLNLEDNVQLRFDGWPAIVISGWPEASTGVFKGKTIVVDKFISENGYYRIMVSPSNSEKVWPEKLSIGTGVKAFIMLREVPIWYELWRQLNGFPANFYNSEADKNKEIKRKAPLKSVK